MIALATPLLLAAGLPCLTLQAQDGSRFGRAVLVLDDLDGDGAPDIAVGAPTAAGNKGRVLVLSGKTQEVLAAWSGPKERSGFGHTLRAVQDVNGDGFDDVLVGFEFWSRTELRSGKDGALVHAIDRAWDEVIPFGDFDGDGAGDLLVTTVYFWEVRSGRTNTLLNGKTWVRERGRFDPIGDVDGDGLVDGVYFTDSAALMLSARPEGGALERIKLYGSSTDRKPLPELWPGILGAEGLAITRAVPAGDLDSDGHADFLVATESDRATSIVGLTNADRSVTLMRSNGTKPLLGGEGSLGYSMIGGIDLDEGIGDDVVFGVPTGPFNVGVVAASGEGTTHQGEGLAFEGAFWRGDWSDGGATSGVSIAAYPDADGDGIPDVLVGTSDWYWHGTVTANGAVRLLSGATGKEIWAVVEQRYGALRGEAKSPK